MMRKALLALFVLGLAGDLFATRIVIRNGDKPGQGFNDATPVAPVGGNNGKTLGEQRLNVFQAAANYWANQLDSNVDIIVTATFVPIDTAQNPCSATSAVLGQARPQLFVANFKNAPRSEVLYPIALANKIAGEDLAPSSADIFVQFNAAIDNDKCLGDSNWYYGLDSQHGKHWDLYVVVLHELAHGLGISGAATAPDFLTNRPAVFDTHTLDLTTGLRWDQMSLAQRRTSLTNTGNVVWDGPLTRAAAPRWLAPVRLLNAMGKDYAIGTASFGAEASRSAMNGRVVQAAEPQACTALTNANAIAGNVALVDRGNCTFVEKARNAQAAGAMGVIVVDHERSTCQPPDMSGEASDITIPVISVRADDGDALKAQLASGVSALLRTDGSQRAGATAEGYLRLYTPCTVEAGSSLHHADTSAFPNLLMEPDISPDLLGGADLTIQQLYDIGWTPQPRTGRRMLKR